MESQKKLPKILLKIVKYDTRSSTGSNLRNILLLTDKVNVDQLSKTDINGMLYYPIEKENMWKISIVKELVDIKSGKI